MTNLINEIELAYAGTLTVNQGWERHGLLAILKMFNNDVQEVIDELVTVPASEVRRVMNAAASTGRSVLLKQIVERWPNLSRTEALIQAASQGHLECMKIVGPSSSRTHKARWALEAAAINGHDEAIKWLMARSEALSVSVNLEAKEEYRAASRLYKLCGDEMNSARMLKKALAQETAGMGQDVSASKRRKM
ncbi:ankyrin repeat domain-containing protein [Pseudoxanthomonas mexicana]